MKKFPAETNPIVGENYIFKYKSGDLMIGVCGYDDEHLEHYFAPNSPYIYLDDVEWFVLCKDFENSLK